MKEFDFSTKRQYIEILNNLPYYPSGRLDPTQFINERSEIYLVSLEDAYEVDNVKHLEFAIDQILSSYQSRLSEKGTAHGDLKLAILRCDFNVVALLLHELRNTFGDHGFRDNTDYAFPDDLFDELLSKQTELGNTQ